MLERAARLPTQPHHGSNLEMKLVIPPLSYDVTRWPSRPRGFPQGEFWVMLHRSMAEYIHKSPDNQARMLLAYFSGMMVSESVGLLCFLFFVSLLLLLPVGKSGDVLCERSGFDGCCR